MLALEETYDDLFNYIDNSRLVSWATEIRRLATEKLIENIHGDIARWSAAVNLLPDVSASTLDIKAPAITIGKTSDLDESQHVQLQDALKGLSPWRKGPFNFFGTHINTEWRSDWKWDRISPHLPNLTHKAILDVGCGSGYHCWRMLGAGAGRVIGIDPSQLFLMQFLAVKKYAPKNAPIDLLPFRMEEIPTNLEGFDVTFSMGVLYHRRAPIDHLLELKGTLCPGGTLVLETLVTDGPLGHSLMPEDRYAMMRNVWFIPSTSTLELWLKRAGFRDVRLVDVSVTTTEEQRATEWMTYQSLADFLDPDDSTKTIEGYPGPKRATFIATK